ncbi:tetratricopeptide repeat protein [Aquella oligotrophica]|nr:tetratricopeptide repeat protein [Aquella oligotrophica]
MKNRFLLSQALIATGSLILFGCATMSAQTTQQYLTATKENLTINPQLAVESSTKIIQSGKPNAEAYHLRGLAYQQLNNFAASESDFQTALKLDQKNESYMVSYANLLCQEQNYTKAQIYYDQAYNQAKKLNHQLTKIYIDNGDCLTTQNKLEPAIASYTNALADESAPVTAYIGIAHAYILQENFPVANYYLGLYKGIPNKQYLQIKLVTLNGLIKTEPKLTNREKIQQTINELKEELGIKDNNQQQASQIAATNKITNSTAPVTIVVKDTESKTTPATNTNNFNSRVKTAADGRSYIIITAGDTLFRISINSKVAIDKLKQINNLKNNEVVTGSKFFLN